MGFSFLKPPRKWQPGQIYKKLKRVYGEGTEHTAHDPDSPKLTRDEVLNKQRNTQFTDYKLYKVIKLIFFMIIFSAALLIAYHWMWRAL